MNHIIRFQRATKVAFCGLAVGMLLVAGGPSPARACNTPVFRYAMYNWPTSPYHVFYFHHGPVAKDKAAEEDAAVNKTIEELSRSDPPANVALYDVDLSEKDRLERLPGVVKKAYESNAEGQQSLHVVYSPWGAEQFVGRLDQKTLEAMVDSPVRKKLGKLFNQRSAAVLLVLTGPDKKANKRAEKMAREVVAKAAAGEVPVAGEDWYGPDQYLPQRPAEETAEGDDAADGGQTEPADEAEGEEPDDPGGLKLGVLKVARTDPAEQWLVRTLLSLESDLDEYPQDPMVFAVYGRGRAMPPYVGKGINVENLLDCAVFLAGACSCMVKDQNPGVDLLMQWDWDKTAEIMAQDDPEFGNDPFGYQEFPLDDPSSQEADGEDASSEDQPAQEGSSPDSVSGGSVSGGSRP